MLGASRAALLKSSVPLKPQTYADLVLSLKPVAYWRLNETSGTTIVDTMGVQNGTYVGPIEFGVEAIVSDTE